MKIKYLPIVFFFSGSLFAQSFLTHDTGHLKVSIFDNGNIGHLGSSSTGSGVSFNGSIDALYSAGFIIGTASRGKVNGHVGSFGIETDFFTSAAFTSFRSELGFNQVAEAEFKDNGAPSPYGVTVGQTSYSNTGDKFMFIKYRVSAAAEMQSVYAGIFADWDVGGAAYETNLGGYDKPRNMAYQYVLGGTNDSNYYGIIALNGMVGARVTAGGSSSTIRDSSFKWISTYVGESIIATGDYRMWIGSWPYNIPAGSALEVHFAIVAGTNLADLKTNADAAIQRFHAVLPVELVSFTAVPGAGRIALNWKTAAEINNLGFEVQRKVDSDKTTGSWNTIAFKKGNGTAYEPNEYSYVDDINGISASSISYRLKQVDFGGRYEYSNEVKVFTLIPAEFELVQNYPNPFNPSTVIKYSIPVETFVNLSVFDILGNKIEVLVDEEKAAGNYEIIFNASSAKGGLSSGMYLYRLTTPEKILSGKMTLIK